MTVAASVVIATRNAASTVDDQLAAMCAQDYAGEWDLIIADNGSRDDTLSKVEAWRRALPKLRVVDADGPHGCSHPRNVGIAASRGDLVLFCDADDIAVPTWVRSMVDGLASYDLVTGPLDRVMLNHRKQYEWMSEDDVHPVGLPHAYSHLPFAAGGNMGIRRIVLETVGAFDVGLKGGEDIDLSWRALDHGYRLGYVPEAVMRYRLRTDARAILLRRFRGGMTEPMLYRLHRAGGMQRDEPRGMPRVYAQLAAGLPRAVRSPYSRWQWAYRAGGRAGRVVGSVRHRTLFL